MIYDLIVIGGGAAGVFAAISAKTAYPQARVLLLEKTAVLLAKVKISGGGRCNVTHACFEPLHLSKHYPRGEKELIGPFHHFQPLNIIEWFESRGTLLKKENDGRMFPITDSSETIIHTLLGEASKLGITIHLRQKIDTITKKENLFHISMQDGETVFSCKNLLLATGSSPQGHLWAQHLGHSIQLPVPSLFTFNIPTSPLKDLSGLSVDPVSLSLPGFPHSQTGPLLITHFGFSGPAAIKLSAWSARFLYEKSYQCPLIVNWLPHLTEEAIYHTLLNLKKTAPHKLLLSENIFKLPKNLWKTLLELQGACSKKLIADLSLKELLSISAILHHQTYQIEGKTTHKEEFVTCGGVHLKEIHFKTMESKACPGLFFAGEILDIDGVTGGFNFQNAWTTAFIAGSSIKI
jgi:predicted Rossmann fold flavoprotein